MRKLILFLAILTLVCIMYAEERVAQPVAAEENLNLREDPPIFTQDPEVPDAVWVDDDFDESTTGWAVTHFATISDAITAVDNFGTINVASGTYDERILIEKPLSIIGSGVSTFIHSTQAPASPLYSTNRYAHVGVRNVWGAPENVVNISNLKIEIDQNVTYVADTHALYYYHTAGVINNVNVDGNARAYTAIGVLGIEGEDIYVEVTNCTVSEFQKGGIYVNTHGYIAGNTVLGITSGGAAANGLQVSPLFYGIVENNQILNGMFYTGDNWTATGLLAMPGNYGTTIVRDNIIYNSQTGLSCLVYPNFGQSSPLSLIIVENNIMYNIDTLDGNSYTNLAVDCYDSNIVWSVEMSGNECYGDLSNSNTWSTAVSVWFPKYSWLNAESCVLDLSIDNDYWANISHGFMIYDYETEVVTHNNVYNVSINNSILDNIPSFNYIKGLTGSEVSLVIDNLSCVNTVESIRIEPGTSIGSNGFSISNSNLSTLSYFLNGAASNYQANAEYNFWGEGVFPGSKINGGDYTSPVDFSPWYTTAEMDISSTGQIAPQNMEITHDGTDVVLSWESYTPGESYKIYSSTGNPYSDSGWDTEVISQTALTWTDESVSETQKYYRVVITTDDDYASDNVYGFITYDCVTTATTNVNLIGLPFEDGYTTAIELAQTNSSCNAISKWNADTQAWQTCSYFSQLDLWIGDFALETGAAYMVGVTADENFIIAGHLPQIPQYNLIHNDTMTDYNYIIVPLDNVETSSNAFVDNGIGNVNCQSVSDWLPTSQEWVTKVYSEVGGVWQWEDGGFLIYPGKPVIVSMENDITWPE